MKVICINDEDDGDCLPSTPLDPKVGDILTVRRVTIGYGVKTGKPYECYIFEEIGEGLCYETKDFALLSSGLDETELVNEIFKTI